MVVVRWRIVWIQLCPLMSSCNSLIFYSLIGQQTTKKCCHVCSYAGRKSTYTEVYETFTAGMHDAVIKPSCMDTMSWTPAAASLFSTPACMVTAINMVVSVSYNPFLLEQVEELSSKLAGLSRIEQPEQTRVCLLVGDSTETCGHAVANAEPGAGEQCCQTSSSSAGTEEEPCHPPAERDPWKRQQGRERGGGGFGFRAEDEDAVGRGCCSGVSKEAKTNRRKDCVILPSRCRNCIRPCLCERTIITSGDWCFKDSEGGEVEPEKTPLHFHRGWQISPYSARSKCITLRLVICNVIVFPCKLNKFSLVLFIL